MEVRYRRELSETFLILEGAEEPDAYTVRVLGENRIPGLSRCQINWVEGRAEYCFGVSGCQTLRRLWESRQLQTGEVRTLLVGLHRALEQMEEYLLEPDRLLLEPDLLFVPEAGPAQVQLCCHPGWKGDFAEGIRGLVQYLLNKMDHGDAQSVEQTYGLFQIVGKDFFCFDELLEALEDPHEQAETAPEEAKPWEPEADREIQNLAWQKPRQAGKEKKSAGKGKLPVEVLAVLAAAAAFFLFRTLNLWQLPDHPASWGLLLLSAALAALAARLLRRREQKLKQKEKRSGRQGALPEELWEGRQQVTDFLAGDFPEDSRERCLISQNSLKHDTIPIRRFPFLLGKMEDVCDACLSHPVISRMHARLEQQNGQIYLVDCNSTNGTYLNGVRLEPNRRYPVQEGDEIMLADLKYLFQ